MLKNLVIRNYALIKELEMQPSSKLNIVTGETGAGKSIMLGAVGLLLGNRADTKSLYDEDTKCVIEGNFVISEYKSLKQVFEEEELDYDAECIIRREISPSGKSRAFINDTPVTLEVLKKVGAFLMDVHSQHDTLLLGANDYQLSVIDSYAGNQDLVFSFQAAYKQYRKAYNYYNRLVNDAAEMKKEYDYNAFLLNELVEAKLEEVDQAAMEEELEKLENAEEIKLKISGVLQVLEYADEVNVSAGLHTGLAELKQIAKYGEVFRHLNERLDSVLIELRDIVRELEAEEQGIELDQERIFLLQDRLSKVFNLQQKHAVADVSSLQKIQAELEEKVSRVQNLDEEIAAAERALKDAEAKMREAGHKLSDSRKAVFEKFVSEVEVLLQDLGMPNARLLIDHTEIEPDASGLDEISILFSANKGVKPQPLKSVASGGEFSRLMFCVKFVLADKTALPTIVFDEIDTGISGEIALKMVKMMQVMAENHQVISISHLPQIAAKGNAHYFVYKDNTTSKTFSRIKKLSEEERVSEIAKMIGGATPSAVAFESARELMAS